MPQQIIGNNEVELEFEGNIVKFLRTKRGKYNFDTRQAKYERLQSAGSALVYLRANPEQLEELRNDKFFSGMHVKPNTAARAVVHYLFDARTENQRAQANDQADALAYYLEQDRPIDELAARLAERGGVNAILEEAKEAKKGVGLAKKGRTARIDRARPAIKSRPRRIEEVERPMAKTVREAKVLTGAARSRGEENVLAEEVVILEVSVPLSKLGDCLGIGEHELRYEVVEGDDDEYRPATGLSLDGDVWGDE